MVDVSKDSLDRYDALMGATIGIFSGLMDVFFVGTPGDSMLGSWTDQKTEDLIIKFAGWKRGEDFTGEHARQNAIQFLEKQAKVGYDHATSKATEGMVDHLSPKNHHVKSLAHCPDLIGLCFAILDQFQMKSSFLSNGQLIRINSDGPSLEGENFVAKICAGFTNWMMHLASDVAGSSGAKGRGSGIPIPFYELFNLCDFGQFGQHRQTLATIMVQVFEQGYDLRHGLAMGIPVVIGNTMTMMGWSFKRRFYHKWDWKNCLPSDQYKSYRRTQLINNGAFCLVDGVDAYIRGKGNPVEIILRMNLIAWLRLVQLIIKELLLTYNKDYADLRVEMEKINQALDEELLKLKAYDYAAWQEENELTRDFNKQLLGKDELVVGNMACDYVFAHQAKLNYKDFDEFDKLFTSGGKLF